MKRGTKPGHADDSFIYEKTENPTIDICLNCTKKKCYGTCADIKPLRDTIVKKVWQTAKDETKISYFMRIDRLNRISWVRDVHKAMKRTKLGASHLIGKIKKYNKEGVLSLVKYEDEVKKITEENRKTYRGKHRIHVDANGNILGKQC